MSSGKQIFEDSRGALQAPRSFSEWRRQDFPLMDRAPVFLLAPTDGAGYFKALEYSYGNGGCLG